MFGRRIINNTLFDKLLPFYYPIFPILATERAASRNTHSTHTLISHVQTAEHDFFIAVPSSHNVIFVAAVTRAFTHTQREIRALRASFRYISVYVRFAAFFPHISLFLFIQLKRHAQTTARKEREREK